MESNINNLLANIYLAVNKEVFVRYYYRVRIPARMWNFKTHVK